MSKKEKNNTSSLLKIINALLALLIILIIIAVFVDNGPEKKSFTELKNFIQKYVFGDTSDQSNKKTEDASALKHNKKTNDKDFSRGFWSDTSSNSANADSALRKTKPLELEPTPQKSSTDLKHLVKDFSGWMEFQHRRAGFKIFHKAYAKRQQNACILFVQATNAFLQQCQGKKSQTVESIWKFWSQRAKSENLVNTRQNFYVIVLDKNLVPVIGSKYKNPEKVWCKN